jgi:hypothetical protein
MYRSERALHCQVHSAVYKKKQNDRKCGVKDNVRIIVRSSSVQTQHLCIETLDRMPNLKTKPTPPLMQQQNFCQNLVNTSIQINHNVDGCDQNFGSDKNNDCDFALVDALGNVEKRQAYQSTPKPLRAFYFLVPSRQRADLL